MMFTWPFAGLTKHLISLPGASLMSHFGLIYYIVIIIVPTHFQEYGKYDWRKEPPAENWGIIYYARAAVPEQQGGLVLLSGHLSSPHDPE